MPAQQPGSAPLLTWQGIASLGREPTVYRQSGVKPRRLRAGKTTSYLSKRDLLIATFCIPFCPANASRLKVWQ